MTTGLKVSAISRRGEVLPESYSIDADYTGDDADWDGTPGEASQDQWKQPVRVATTASITISTALNAGDTLDGVTLAAGDRVLVKDQSTGSQNGIYVVAATPYRATDFDDDDEVLGALVYVIAGTANGGKAYRVTNTTAPVVDTDTITWLEFGGAGSFSGDAGDVPADSTGYGNSSGTDVQAILDDFDAAITAAAGASGGYPVIERRVAWFGISDGTINVNTTSYNENGGLVSYHDFDAFPATHFLLTAHGRSTESGQTVTLQLVEQGSASTALSASGNDLAIGYNGGTSTYWSSGWIAFGSAQSGLKRLSLAFKGSNSSVDYTGRWMDLALKVV